MDFKIFHFKIHHDGVGAKEGFLLRGSNDAWSEVSPLPGRSRETLPEALVQLKAIQQGYVGPLLPSVALGLFGLTASKISTAPICLFLSGTPQAILQQAKTNHGCNTAKVKIGSFDLSTAVSLIQTLKQNFRLRLDIGESWPREKILSFCSHFVPSDFEFIEDPGHDIAPFPMASDAASHGNIVVWKPMIRGLPARQAAVILSSSYESGIGLHQIAALAHTLHIPVHPLGIGTFINLQDDLLQEPLHLHNGHLHFPSPFRIKQERLTLC